MVVFKFVTALCIISLYPTAHAAVFLGLTNAIWFALLAAAARARRRSSGAAACACAPARKQLIDAEWNVEPTESRPTARR